MNIRMAFKAAALPALLSVIIVAGCAKHPDALVGNWEAEFAAGPKQVVKVICRYNPDGTGLQTMEAMGKKRTMQFNYTHTDSVITETLTSQLLDGKPLPLPPTDKRDLNLEFWLDKDTLVLVPAGGTHADQHAFRRVK